MNVEKIRRIESHGRDLLTIFPNATELDPLALCKKLRRLENQAARIALRLCNGPEYAQGEADAACDAILAKVCALLDGGTSDNCRPAGVSILLNRYPRGYQLKISDEWLREAIPAARSRHETVCLAAALAKLHTDGGGYGILAPEIT
jgi:hypothetical protein